MQTQIESKDFSKKTLANLRRVVAKGFEEGDLHLLNLCEVGGHKQGLPAVHCHASNITDQALKEGEYGSCATQNYMSIWHETGASQPGGVSLKLSQEPEVFTLAASVALEPQLVLSSYAVTTNVSEGEGMLFVGQLHIRTPNGKKSPTNQTKKRVVQEALNIMTNVANICVFQPVVAVLCGDANLNQDNADACCQVEDGVPDARTHWHTQTSSEALSGDVAFVRGSGSEAFDVTIGASYKDRGVRNDSHDFFGVTVSVPLFRIPEAPSEKQIRFEDNVDVKCIKARWSNKADDVIPASTCVSQPGADDAPSASASTSQPQLSDDMTPASTCVSQPGADDASSVSASTSQPQRSDDLTPASTCVSQPGADDASSASAFTSQPQRRHQPRNALSHGVADSIVKDMKAWYAERADDEGVAKTWKHLHTVLFKKVRVRNPNDIWWQGSDDTVEGLPMVVSAEFVALQVKKVIERREQWLRDNSLPLQTIMNENQKDVFLKEVKAEYHGSDDQKRRQEADKAGGKNLQAGKKQRWSRECQRRGGTTQMFHLLSFSGRWDASFFETSPVPQQVGEQAEQHKQATFAAVEARAKLRLAKKYDRLGKTKRLHPDQAILVAKLHDGTLEAEAKRSTMLSGHGKVKLNDGTFVNIGGSTGGFTRAVLYNWTPPILDNEF